MKQPLQLIGFAIGVAVLGFLPFVLLSRSQARLSTPPLTADRPSSAAPELKSPQIPARSLGLHLEVRLSQRQVRVFQGDRLMKTYPIAIGQDGWETPTGTFYVNQKIQEPRWVHPFTDESIAPNDPRNPLGKYWIGFWTDGHHSIGFHGTPDPDSIGDASSHGCLRMYNQDVEELFHWVDMSTVVTVLE